MTENLSGEFKFIQINKVIFGPGTAVANVRNEVAALGRKRAFIITGSTLNNKTDLVERVKTALGEMYAGVYDKVTQHVPRKCVLDAAEMAKEAGADVLVSIGGGSPIDAAKGVTIVVAEGERLDDHMVRFEPPDKTKVPPLNKPKMPHIAISTTLSGAEFTPASGITDEKRKCKDVYMNPQLVPRVIILDPEMTVATGRVLWASTGMKVLSDCVEIISSLKHQPFTDALCLHAARLIYKNLPLSVVEPLDLSARAQLQQATWMTLYGLTNVWLGIAAGLRHQIGSMCHVPHGIASTIVFPHAMRFNRSVVADRQAMIAEAIGINTQGMTSDEAAATAIDAVQDLTSRLRLPQRLRDVGVQESDLEHVAAAAMEDFTMYNNPKRITSREQVLEVLRNAW